MRTQIVNLMVSGPLFRFRVRMEATVMRSEWRPPASFEWRRMRMEAEIALKVQHVLRGSFLKVGIRVHNIFNTGQALGFMTGLGSGPSVHDKSRVRTSTKGLSSSAGSRGSTCAERVIP
ncbi:uncharacterized protein G2W53_033832 [Senna tora]|uniref:Uncharacterized protein n=1 Tax=Senna tora TaxID=362788 RepID=A0A834WBC7_9FABA|nr:uncharacterized protein G2W53_033832 [Senna tora]